MIFVPSKYRPCEKRIVPRVAIPSVTLENHPFLVVLREEQKLPERGKSGWIEKIALMLLVLGDNETRSRFNGNIVKVIQDIGRGGESKKRRFSLQAEHFFTSFTRLFSQSRIPFLCCDSSFSLCNRNLGLIISCRVLPPPGRWR